MHTLTLSSPSVDVKPYGVQRIIYAPRIDNVTGKLSMLRVWEKANMQV